jgi:hypothetical protein
MAYWLRIDTTPPAQIYAHSDARAHMDLSLPTHRVSDLTVSAVQAQAGRSNTSWSAVITGASSDLLARIGAQALYGVRIRWYDGATLERDAITDGVQLRANAVTVTAQADIWSADLPIRSTADLREYRDTAPVPRRYGRDVPGVLLQLGPQRTRWLWADHASATIRRVTADGLPIAGWAWRNTQDATGRPITIVETTEPVEDGVELVATGDGALDPIAGTLMTNPADVVYDLAALAGLSIARGTLHAFRAACAARNLEISGSVDGGTLQAAVESIASSVHALLVRTHPDLLILQPGTAAASGSLAESDITAISGDAGDIATRLLVRYGVEETGPRRSLEVRARALELVRGVRSREVSLPWVRDSRVAADVAERMLQDLARPTYQISYAAQRRQWQPGERATITETRLGLSGTGTVESVNGRALTVLARLGATPSVTLETLAEAYAPEAYAGATVTAQGDQRIIRITAPDGSPVVGAACTLDGAHVRTTDNAGAVSWPASLLGPGEHVIDVDSPEYEPYQLRLVL